MRLAWLAICPLFLGSIVVGQENRDLIVNLDNFRYPPIAAAARAQGDVTFEISASGQKLVSGHPLLVAAAQANLQTWTLPPVEGGKYLINIKYTLEIIEPGTKQETVLIGDKLDRFFLRLVRAPTRKIVTSCYRDPARTPPLHYSVLSKGSDYTVDVFVTEQAYCVVASYSFNPSDL